MSGISQDKTRKFLSSLFDTVKLRVFVEHRDLYEVRQMYPKRLNYRDGQYSLKGRFGTPARLASRKGQGALYVEASIPKFLTGQNLIGTENIHQGAIELIDEVLARLRIQPSRAETDRYRSGDFDLMRVDYASHLWCGSQAGVDAVMHALRLRTVAKTWEFSQYRNESLYWSPHSRRSTLKAYDKLKELAVRPMPTIVRHREILMQKAVGLVRFELTLRAKELQRLGLNRAEAWTVDRARDLLEKRVKAVLPLDGSVICLPGIEYLGDRTRTRLELFLRGQSDAFSRYPRARRDDRREILLHTGIDIDSVLTPDQQRACMETIQEAFRQGWGYYSWERKWPNMRKGKSGLM